MDSYYYCLDGQNVLGPTDLFYLKDLVAQGGLPPTAHVIKEGTDHWITMAEFANACEKSSPLPHPPNETAHPRQVQGVESAQSVTFKAATCPSCGGPLQVPTNMQRVKCMYCGSDVVIEKPINKASEVELDNYLTLARTAEAGSNYSEAYKYFSKAIELDNSNSEAWMGKGRCAGLLSTIKKPNILEMISSYQKALEFEIPKDVRSKASRELTRIAGDYKWSFHHDAIKKRHILKNIEYNLKNIEYNRQLQSDCLTADIWFCMAAELAYAYEPLTDYLLMIVRDSTCNLEKADNDREIGSPTISDKHLAYLRNTRGKYLNLLLPPLPAK